MLASDNSPNCPARFHLYHSIVLSTPNSEVLRVALFRDRPSGGNVKGLVTLRRLWQAKGIRQYPQKAHFHPCRPRTMNRNM